MREKVVFFKRKFAVVTCQSCDEFSVDILEDGNAQDKVFAHAKSHAPDVPDVSVSIIEDLSL